MLSKRKITLFPKYWKPFSTFFYGICLPWAWGVTILNLEVWLNRRKVYQAWYYVISYFLYLKYAISLIIMYLFPHKLNDARWKKICFKVLDQACDKIGFQQVVLWLVDVIGWKTDDVNSLFTSVFVYRCHYFHGLAL